jgi:L-fuconolactonase
MLVDSHAHVWGPELLGVPWLAARAADGIRRPFPLDELERELALEAVEKVVLVSADETVAGDLHLLALASQSVRAGAVVCSARVTEVGIAETVDHLRRAAGGELLRGVRVSAPDDGADGWRSGDVVAGLARLRDLGLLVEVLATPADLGALAEACRAVPGLTMIVDHLGGPAAGRLWRDGIRELADTEGVVLKVSGAPVFQRGFAEALATVREHFGADRLMAGSDWPVSTLHGRNAWRRVIDAASGWSPGERAALAGDTAARIYGIAA